MSFGGRNTYETSITTIIFRTNEVRSALQSANSPNATIFRGQAVYVFLGSTDMASLSQRSHQGYFLILLPLLTFVLPPNGIAHLVQLHAGDRPLLRI